MGIDSEKTKNLIKTYLPDSLNTCLKELSPNLVLQYEFLEKLLLDRKKGEVFTNDLLILNLNLMCKLGLKKEVWLITENFLKNQ